MFLLRICCLIVSGSALIHISGRLYGSILHRLPPTTCVGLIKVTSKTQTKERKFTVDPFRKPK